MHSPNLLPIISSLPTPDASAFAKEIHFFKLIFLFRAEAAMEEETNFFGAYKPQILKALELIPFYKRVGV
jgi:hypothetical protein